MLDDMDKSFWELALAAKEQEIEPDFYFENQPEGERELEFSQFFEKTKETSGNLKKMGVKKGDRVLIAGDNSPQFLESVYAANRIGATVSLVDPDQAERKISFIANKLSPTLSLAEESLSSNKQNHLAKNSKEVAPLNEVNKVEKEKPHIPDADPNQNTKEMAFVLWTSGSTGDPKGVKLSQRNLTHNMEGTLQLLTVNEKDRIGSIAPWYHIMGFSYTLGLPFVTGASVHYITKMLKILDTIGEEEITMCLGAPRLFSKLVAMIHRKARHKLDGSIFSKALKAAARLYIRRKLSDKFRFLASGSSKLPPDLVISLDDLELPSLEGYGLTETSPLLAMEILSKRKPDAVGIALPNINLEIIDPKTKTKNKRGEPGEIIVSGENVFLGYLGEPELTEEAFLRGWAEKGDRWFQTGDIAYFDQESLLHIEGRKDNRVATAAGKNVQLEEVEEMLRMPLEKSDLVENFFIGSHYTSEGTQLRAVVRPSNRAKKKIKKADDKIGRLEQLTSQKIKKELHAADAADYEIPKNSLLVNEIELTNNGDIVRNQDPNTYEINDEQELYQHFEQLKQEKERKRRELT